MEIRLVEKGSFGIAIGVTGIVLLMAAVDCFPKEGFKFFWCYRLKPEESATETLRRRAIIILSVSGTLWQILHDHLFFGSPRKKSLMLNSMQIKNELWLQ